MKRQIIKISWAKDSEGKVIHVNDAIKDNNYYCPCCDEKLILRAGTIKRKHFSHRNDSKEGANKQVISSQADSLIKISRIWADFFPANTSNQPI